MSTPFDDPEAARPKLPADVLAFVTRIENKISAVEALALLSPSEQREKQLCAIVREQAANAANWQRASGCANPDTLAAVIADFYKRAECRPPLDGIPDGIDRIKAERDELRERLTKLETAVKP